MTTILARDLISRSKTAEGLAYLDAASQGMDHAKWQALDGTLLLQHPDVQSLLALKDTLEDKGIPAHFTPAENPSFSTGDAFPAEPQLAVKLRDMLPILGQSTSLAI